MFIDTTYFRSTLSLNASSVELTAVLNEYIVRYENEFLDKALGYQLAQLLRATPAEQRFIDLLQGKEYTYNDATYKWQGLANSTTKASPIANYVYCQYVRNTAVILMPTGAQTATTENASRVDPTDKIVFAWQDMARVNMEMYHYLTSNNLVYPEYEKNIACFRNYPPIMYGYGFYGVFGNPLYNPNGGGNRIGI